MANESNFIEIDIKKMDYDLPQKGAGKAGSLDFSSVQLSWDGMNVGINNTDEVFKSEIFYRNRYFGIAGKYLNLGFSFPEENPLSSILSLDIEESKFLINPLFFSFNGNKFRIVNDVSNLSLTKFNLYCGGIPGVDMTKPDGIIKGCLTDSLISGKDEGDLAGAEIKYDNKDEKSPILFSSKLDQVELRDNKITANVSKSAVDIPAFKIEAGETVVSCDKDPELLEMDGKKIAKDCLNSLDVVSRKILFTDRKEETKFFIDVENLKVIDEQFLFRSPTTQMLSSDKGTTLSNLTASCYKDEETELNDMQGVIGDCFKKGNVSISRIISDDNSGKFEDLFRSIFDTNVDPREIINETKSDIKNLSIAFQNNKMILTARVRVLVKDFTITIKANVEHYPEENTMVFNVTKTKLPLGIKWRWLLMYVLKKKMVGSFISYEGNSITIKI